MIAPGRAVLGLALGLALVFALAGCPARHATTPPAAPTEGISVAIYLGKDPETVVALVDDRQRVTVAGGAFVPERLAPGARVLVLEAVDPETDRAAFQIGPCTRPRIEGGELARLALRSPGKPGAIRPPLPAPPPGVIAPQLRCAVTAAPGPHLVRIVQQAPLPLFRALHHVSYDGGPRATLTTRFAISTPAWGVPRASLVVFDGIPGGDRAPVPVTRSELPLDGRTTTLANPPIERPARRRVLYVGAGPAGDTPPSSPRWRADSRSVVLSVLELEDSDLVAGPIDVQLGAREPAPRELTIEPRDRERLGDTLRLPLGTVDTIQPSRRSTTRITERAGRKVLVQDLVFELANLANEARTISIEEPLRPGLARALSTLPSSVTVVGDTLRAELLLPPYGKASLEVRVTYTL